MERILYECGLASCIKVEFHLFRLGLGYLTCSMYVSFVLVRIKFILI